MREIKLTADELVASLLRLSESEPVCLLDSSGVGHLGSHRLIAGVRPVEILELDGHAEHTLELLNDRLSGNLSAIFTLSYDFGSKLHGLKSPRPVPPATEPDVFLALYDSLIFHDYTTGRTYVSSSDDRCVEIIALLNSIDQGDRSLTLAEPTSRFTSNFTKSEYIEAVEQIREHIRRGDTYQTNLTQQLSGVLSDSTTPQTIFARLRRDHPAPFSAFLNRRGSTVVSASPERFFRVGPDHVIEASPIKGTRPRGKSPEEDDRLRAELEASEKDRAENTMIVDLTRNDLGRVCEYGSVQVESLWEIEEHPTLFHLVSTVRGNLRRDARFSDVLTAVYPCGSITGAPKLRTMQIIDEIENVPRGLSMGAIGCRIAPAHAKFESEIDVNVAIRTMVIREKQVTFNVGGGVVIDSEPNLEYDESLLKARALLAACGGILEESS